MKIEYSILSNGKKTRFEISGDPSSEDIFYYSTRKGKLAKNMAFFELPFCANEKLIHPDLIALVALLCFRPFTSKEIIIQGGVSEVFSKSVFDNMKIIIGPVTGDILPRKSPINGVEGLAFSGGNDSVAALYLSPKNTKAFFLNRSADNVEIKSIYKNDAAINSCNKVEESGFDVIKINSSLEYLREPIGFPVDWSNSAPALLCADFYDIRSIAFGLVLESAYFLGHSHYSDLTKRAIYSSWAPLFSAASIPISLPTAGLSEVITSKISSQYVPHWFAQSCVRGVVGKPCMRCFKCFRKRLLDFEISGLVVNDDHFDIPMVSKEVSRRLLENPIHHENVIAFSMRNIKYNHPISMFIKEKNQVILDKYNNLDFLMRFYFPAAKLIPEHIRDYVIERINAVSINMTFNDIEIVESWQLDYLLRDVQYLGANEKLRDFLK